MEILEIANKIRENGGNLYLAGGAVRDKIIGNEILEKINRNYIKENCNIKDERKIGEMLRNKRIELIKSIENKNKVI